MKNKSVRNKSFHYNVDIIELSKSMSNPITQKGLDKPKKVRGIILTIVTTTIFFGAGYLVASLYIPPWLKVLLFILVAIFGIIPGYILSHVFH